MALEVMNSLLNLGCLRGVFVGSLLTSGLFVLLYAYITTWTTQISYFENHLYFQRVATSLELDEDSWDVVESLDKWQKGKIVNSRKQNGKQTDNRKKTLLSIVPASRQTALRSYTILKKSWWQSSNNSKMLLDTSSYLPSLMQDEDAMKRLHFAANCSDFSSFSGQLEDDWSPKQVKCLLKEVYEKFGREYNWFVISPAQTFLSTLELERILANMDPLSVTYLGLPDHNHNDFCSVGPGIILSRKALQNIIPHLDDCLIDYQDGSAQEYLGFCFRNKFNTHCRQLHKAERYFISKNKTGLDLKLEYLNQQFISVYPVYYEQEMMSLYQADLIRNVRYHLDKVKQIKKDIYQSSICTKSTYTPNTNPVNKSSLQPTPWTSFDSKWTYSRQINPLTNIEGKTKKEMEFIAKLGLRQYNEDKKTKLTFSNIKYGMQRNRVRGMEYMLDVETEEDIEVRLHMMHTYKHQLITLRDSSYEAFHNYVNFVVPVSNVTSRFAEFMTMYEKVCLKVHTYCKLHLVVYGGKDVQLITRKIAYYKSKYSSAVINIVPGAGNFSRGRALHQGISILKPDDLIFTCDVDVTIKRTFVDRCRQNAIQGRRVYYPEVFKYYNMDYVYWYKKNSDFQSIIDRSHGHWCWYGFGMFCMYKSDYDSLGGYNLSIKGWGGEDIELAKTTLQKHYEMLRAPDPGLSHRYHPRTCSKDLSKVKHRNCISSRNEGIADSRQLASYIHHLESTCLEKSFMEYIFSKLYSLFKW